MQLDELIPRHAREVLETIRKYEEAIPRSVRDAIEAQKRIRDLVPDLPQSARNAMEFARKFEESDRLARSFRDGLSLQKRLTELVPKHYYDVQSALQSIQAHMPESRLQQQIDELQSAIPRASTEEFRLPALPIAPLHRQLVTSLHFKVSMTERALHHVRAVCGDDLVTVPNDVLENLAVGDEFEFAIADTKIVFIVVKRRVSHWKGRTHIQIVLDAASAPRPEIVGPSS